MGNEVADVLAGVAELLPGFRERAQDTEDARRISEESIKAPADTRFSGMAQTALYDGKFVSENLKRLASGKHPWPYKPRKPIYVTPVGKRWAAVQWGNLQIARSKQLKRLACLCCCATMHVEKGNLTVMQARRIQLHSCSSRQPPKPKHTSSLAHCVH